MNTNHSGEHRMGLYWGEEESSDDWEQDLQPTAPKAVPMPTPELGSPSKLNVQQGPGSNRKLPKAPATGTKKPQTYSKPDSSKMYLPGKDDGSYYFDIDPPKRRNAAYRVRRDLRQEECADMPLVITATELRAGVAEDDRAWNLKFNTLREEFTREIEELREAIGGRLRIELAWRTPLQWPRCTLVAPDGKRIADTDSKELARYGVRSTTMLWKSILAKQRKMQEMARGYEALLTWMSKLPAKVAHAMAGPPSCRMVLEPFLRKQISSLTWPCYDADDTGGPCSPLPFAVAEAMRVRLWAYTKAIKQHVHTMNIHYNRVTNERRINYGMTRRAGLAVGILEGACWMPRSYWALWVRTGSKNLLYRTVTPRIVSKARGKYFIKDSSFPVADKNHRLRMEAVDRCHLTHMKDIYRAADLVLEKLDPLSAKTAELVVQMMGRRHGSDSPAACGRSQWQGSGKFFRWEPWQ